MANSVSPLYHTFSFLIVALPGVLHSTSNSIDHTGLERVHFAPARRNDCTVISSVEVDDAEPEHDQVQNEKADTKHPRSITFERDSDCAEAVEGTLEKVPTLPLLLFSKLGRWDSMSRGRVRARSTEVVHDLSNIAFAVCNLLLVHLCDR